MSDASTSQGGARPILRGQGLVRVYPDGDVQALRGVSLAVEQGESVVISNGSVSGRLRHANPAVRAPGVAFSTSRSTWP